MTNNLKLKIGRIANVVTVMPLNVPAWARDKNLLIKNDGYQLGHSDYCKHIVIDSISLYIPNALFDDCYISCYEFASSDAAKEWVDNITTIIKTANAEHPDIGEVDYKILWDTVC